MLCGLCALYMLHVLILTTSVTTSTIKQGEKKTNLLTSPHFGVSIRCPRTLCACRAHGFSIYLMIVLFMRYSKCSHRVIWHIYVGNVLLSAASYAGKMMWEVWVNVEWRPPAAGWWATVREEKKRVRNVAKVLMLYQPLTHCQISKNNFTKGLLLKFIVPRKLEDPIECRSMFSFIHFLWIHWLCLWQHHEPHNWAFVMIIWITFTSLVLKSWLDDFCRSTWKLGASLWIRGLCHHLTVLLCLRFPWWRSDPRP